MKDFTQEFYCLLGYIGWGDPYGGIWTIGVEEGEEWCSDDKEYDLDSIRKRIRKEYCKEYSLVPKEENLKWPIAYISAKIACGVSKSYSDQKIKWQTYRDEKLWKEGSKVFNGNLYPLGRKFLKKGFPKCYFDLFGITDISTYKEVVRKERFEMIRKLRDKCTPQGIVCYGKGFWNEFEEAFKLDKKEGVLIDKHIKVYKKQKVILTRHFVGMSDSLCENIINQLRDWNVQIP